MGDKTRANERERERERERESGEKEMGLVIELHKSMYVCMSAT